VQLQEKIKVRVGLIGYGKAGQAVAQVLAQDARVELKWIARQSVPAIDTTAPPPPAPVLPLVTLLDDATRPRDMDVDAIVDFSSAASIHQYAPWVTRHRLTVVSAISAYGGPEMAKARELGRVSRVMCSPNITLGINFLIMAARLLRSMAPFADVEILEQHFRDKPEVSGTARKIAEQLELNDEHITSLRLGGIIGHHEVIFGFPYQTVRIVHDSIRREAFGTGAVFALESLQQLPAGLYTFEDLLLAHARKTLALEPQPPAFA